MISKIKIQNLKIRDTAIDKVEINLSKGFNLIPNYSGNFIIWLIRYLNSRLCERHRLNKLLELYPAYNKNDLGYFDIYVTNKNDEVIKYSSTYADNNIFTESLWFGNNLIGHYDYFDNTLETGKNLWDRFGEVEYGSSTIDTKLFCNTIAGQIIREELNNFIVCNSYSFIDDYSIYKKPTFSYKGVSLIKELNELLPLFGFDVELKEDGLVYLGDSKIGMTVEMQGSGFNHLLKFLPEVLYTMKSNDRNLVTICIPSYGTNLHFLLKKQLKQFFIDCGLNIIATDFEENIKKEEDLFK